ncbi:hypothetical protein ACVWWG_008787 [Bradyrhizobium sp. LB7.2]
MRLFIFGCKAPFRAVISILPVACNPAARERNREK